MASIASTPSNTSIVTSSSANWWLKDPLNEANNKVIDVDLAAHKVEHPQEGATFSPLGRNNKVHVSELFRGAEFPISIACDNVQAFNDLMVLLQDGRPLLWQSWEMRQWYMIVNGEVRYTRENYGSFWAVISCDLIEVDAP